MGRRCDSARVTGADRRRPPAALAAPPFALTAVTEEDWPVEVALSATPDVAAWTYYPAGLDEVAARARLLRQQARAAEGLVQRYVVRDGAGTALGTCGITGLPADEPEVFYALLPAARGRGAVTAAVLALVAWAEGAGYGSVALMTVEGNAASERVAQRAGFTERGTSTGEQRGRQVVLRRWARPTSPAS